MLLQHTLSTFDHFRGVPEYKAGSRALGIHTLKAHMLQLLWILAQGRSALRTTPNVNQSNSKFCFLTSDGEHFGDSLFDLESEAHVVGGAGLQQNLFNVLPTFASGQKHRVRLLGLRSDVGAAADQQLDDLFVSEVDRSQKRIELILGSEVRVSSAIQEVARYLQVSILSSKPEEKGNQSFNEINEKGND